MAKRKVIGILGGMGPAATVLLQQKLIQAIAAEDDADHVPLLVDVNTQVPSRVAALVEGTGPSPEPVLVAMAKRLEQMGVAALAMPCNTAHIYADAIRAAVDVPLLDMVEQGALTAVAHLPPSALTSGGRIGLLGSTALEKLGLYATPLRRFGRAALVYPARQALLMEALKAFKRRADDPTARAILEGVAQDLVADGCDVLLVACTEFSLAVDVLPATVPVVDALDALVTTILEAADA
ncbi:MAG: aspartate/glutamate racemase family protein [Geminicoccaceae bacterium]|nr:MAG: aspartate/glutamate racemase family protein [Geminicoccaceae bacterium]